MFLSNKKKDDTKIMITKENIINASALLSEEISKNLILNGTKEFSLLCHAQGYLKQLTKKLENAKSKN